MKWYHFFILAVLGFFAFFARKSSTSGRGSGSGPSPDSAAEPMGRGTLGPRPGRTPEGKSVKLAGTFGGDPEKVVLADQDLYPGFYVTEYGAWVNPDTGEVYPPGTSPPARPKSAIERGAAQSPTYDLQPDDYSDKNAPPDETIAGGFDVVT